MNDFKYEYYNSGNIREAIKEKKNVILPLGAVEAHDIHLPLNTDNILVEYYTNKLAENTNSLVLPTMNYGAVWSLSDASGSIDIGTKTLVELIKNIGLSLAKNGAKMLTLISAHFGNIDAAKTAARELYEISDIKVIYMTYPNIRMYLDIFDVVNDHSLYLHACEVETSMMMHIDESLVAKDKLREGVLNVPEETGYTPTKWTDFTDVYIMGDARLSTKEKGKEIFTRVINDAVGIINREKDKL
ncbi:MAG: creatininase family protein [Peptoniphilaceae bacterium]|nr:creatininase family protein [Peptoniphilaceae bacterium]MDY6018977.1 creatininase family protein [Anaerococcus sp.]